MLNYQCLETDSYCGTSHIELDGIHIYIDPGSDDSLKHPEVPEQPDLILLSHSDLAHIGGLVYAYYKYDWKNAYIYATLPTINMGRMTMLDAIKSNYISDMSKADVDAVFDSIIPLRYQQPTLLLGKCSGLTITAYNAGHTLGGTLWSLIKESESVLYAVDWNHSKDKHLNGAALYSNGHILEALNRPNTLITDANNSLVSIPSRKKRDEAFIESVMSSLLKGGTVLLPVDAASRVLELCCILDNHWSASQPPLPFPILFLSPTSTKTIDYAKSMIEWMGDNIVRDFGINENLLEFRNINTITDFSQISHIGPGPKVILATALTLECGFSQRILLDLMSENSNDLILFTQRSRCPQNSLANQFIRYWERASKKKRDIPHPVGLYAEQAVKIKTKEPLEGEELRSYQELEFSKRNKDAEDTALEFRNRTILDEDLSSSSSSEDDDLDLNTEVPHVALGSSAFLMGKSFDLNLRDPAVQALHTKYKMFPYIEKRRRIDEYGEIIKHQDFSMINEPANTLELENDSDDNALSNSNGKRKWSEINDGLQQKKEEEDEDEVPSKIITDEKTIRVSCQVQFIDIEGLHDGRSLKTIIPQVNPRRLVLIHASTEEKEDMKKTCASLSAFTKDVYIPNYGEIINVSIDVNAFSLKLADDLIKNLIWTKVGNCEVSHMLAKVEISKPSEEEDKKEEVEKKDGDKERNEEKKEEKETLPVLNALTLRSDLARAPRAAPLLVGNIRLAYLRKALLDQGISAELKGEGVLLCGGAVAVRKLSGGKISVEGSLSNRFFEIRKLVYDALAVV
ncbi:mRNA cleavage and polyadenylation specificity factor complex, metallo-beta-lactamase/beta-CASP protein Cft2 [Schizosaccharomyces pombe]|uniref:Cleavage factor two protein 2 n=1 Tax=Schizosaccharomyces pombe (strain 972 / ATCC 24843) TaxID=284812 RepID=CFT2_SCHPO|nr:putative cleavage/polyadenylation factor Cft2/CPSF-73 [Schizosaccharomyces pombe]O74740.1 RecName: Full=Cleavage factor two protein 2 [Schizosaccharomyces pombe 972h-]CAA21254.1 cleavage factor two Cft2/polyadenylation factor CPSF-73 (predicted) [Schizosaccharomyces pombe]|eukprot:NP_595448.1 putative cleavage/polyadenylation factor Cft2/CPSF-73 [Schizosaccharomyces pombe]